MALGLGLGIGKGFRKALSIVKMNLQLWLGFEKSEVIGSELVVNGDFETDSDWVKTGGATTTGGVGFLDNSPASSLSQNILTIGDIYRYTLIAKSDSGSGDLKMSDGTTLHRTIDNVPTEFTSYSGSFVADNTSLTFSESGAGDISIDNVSVKEVTQFAKDKSTNTNNAKLFTGKALSFNGNDAVTDFGNPNINLKSICFWVNLGTTTEQIINLTATQSIEVVSGVITLNGTWSNSNIYVDGINTTSIGTTHQRVVVTTDTNILVSDLEFARIGSDYGSLDLADVQIYDAEFTLADSLLDYNNPNHLIFDIGGSISLSNLKGYWALSEGAGDFAYNSAVALGSEEVVNGDFATNIIGWTGSDAAAELEWDSGRIKVTNGDGSAAGVVSTAINVEIGKTYLFGFESSQGTSVNESTSFGFGTSTTNVNKFWLTGASGFTTDGLHTYMYTSDFTGTGYVVVKNATIIINEYMFFDNISVKEVSVGTINGATPVLAQATIPQLGLMDWAKSTVGSDEITLVQAPNNEGYDILGNALRLRENAFNLDGSGYGQVADDDSLDFGTGDFSIECWLKIGEANAERIIDKRDGSSGYTLYRTSSNVLKLELNDGTGNSGFTISSAQSSGVWVHVAVVGVRDGDATCYIDADAETPISISGKSGNLDSSSPLIIGADAPLGDTLFSTDIIDDVRIYNRALSSDEVEQNYKAGKSKHKN
jgi:hypothetical protein